MLNIAQEVEPAAEIAIISSQTASAKVFQGFFLYGRVWGDRTGDQRVHDSCKFILGLTALVQQQQVP